MLQAIGKSRKTKRIFSILFLCCFVFLFLGSSVFLFFSSSQPAQALKPIEKLMERPELREYFPTTTAESVIVNVVTWMMSIIGIICVVFIIYGGIRYATSRGNEQEVEKAKKILLYAIIGLVIAIVALVIAQVVTVAVTGGDACEVFDTNTNTLNCIADQSCRDLAICTEPGIFCTPAYSACPRGDQLWMEVGGVCRCWPP